MMKTILLHRVPPDVAPHHYIFFKDEVFAAHLAKHGYRMVPFYHGLRLDSSFQHILFQDAFALGLERFGLRRRAKGLVLRMVGAPYPDTGGILEAAQATDMVRRSVFFQWEGPVGMPENFSNDIRKMFPAILTWSSRFAGDQRFVRYRIAQDPVWPDAQPVAFESRKLLVNISSNGYAYHRGELYSLRRKEIRYFEKRWFDNFDLYGLRWNTPSSRLQRMFRIPAPRYPSYRGPVKHKGEVLGRYRFALAYENAIDRGWITEKIFDVMRSGCVPVYLGDPEIAQWVPPECFVDRRKFRSHAELGDYLESVGSAEYDKYQQAIREYLHGPGFKPFSAEDFAVRVADAFARVRG